jgi:hypothetical protein
MVAAPSPGAGNVPIRLLDKDYELKPSLEACMSVNKLAGGLNAVIQKCANMDFETICDVICIGLSATSGPQQKEVQELVYRTGAINVAGDAIMFVRTVANGGVVPKDDDEEAEPEAEGPLADGSASESSTTSS